MENLFRVVSAAELSVATATGVLPRCPSDERSNCIHLNELADVETVAGLYFDRSELPVVLEIRRRDIEEGLAFQPATPDKPFRQVTLARANILLSWVVAVHRLEWAENSAAGTFRLLEADAAVPTQVTQAKDAR